MSPTYLWSRSPGALIRIPARAPPEPASAGRPFERHPPDPPGKPSSAGVTVRAWAPGVRAGRSRRDGRAGRGAPECHVAARLVRTMSRSTQGNALKPVGRDRDRPQVKSRRSLISNSPTVLRRYDGGRRTPLQGLLVATKTQCVAGGVDDHVIPRPCGHVIPHAVGDEVSGVRGHHGYPLSGSPATAHSCPAGSEPFTGREPVLGRAFCWCEPSLSRARRISLSTPCRASCACGRPAPHPGHEGEWTAGSADQRS